MKPKRGEKTNVRRTKDFGCRETERRTPAIRQKSEKSQVSVHAAGKELAVTKCFLVYNISNDYLKGGIRMTTTSYFECLDPSCRELQILRISFNLASIHARRSSKASSTYAPSWRCCQIRADDSIFWIHSPQWSPIGNPGDEAEYYILQNKYFVVRMILSLISEKIIDKVLVTVDVNWSKQCSPSVFVIRMPWWCEAIHHQPPIVDSHQQANSKHSPGREKRQQQQLLSLPSSFLGRSVAFAYPSSQSSRLLLAHPTSKYLASGLEVSFDLYWMLYYSLYLI